jgi:hypothetical protein
MAQDILKLTSTLDFSLPLESVTDYTLVIDGESKLAFDMKLMSKISPIMQLPSNAELEERDLL